MPVNIVLLLCLLNNLLILGMKFAEKIVVKVYSQKHKSLLSEKFTSLLLELFDLMREWNVFQAFITFLCLNSSRSDDSKGTCTCFTSKWSTR